MPRILFSLLVLATLSTAAFAQQSGSEQERRACSGDVRRYCKMAILGGDFAILGCLQQNRARISKPCKQVLADHGV